LATTGFRAATWARAPAGAKAGGLTAAAMLVFASNSLLCRTALDGGHADAAIFTALRFAAGAVAFGVVACAGGSAEPAGRGAWGSAAALLAYVFAFSRLSARAGRRGGARRSPPSS
jgi:hypothetical protein